MRTFMKESGLPKKCGHYFRAVADFLCCALLLCLVGSLAYQWMDGLLKESLIELAARQSKTLAFSMEQQFDQELDRLRTSTDLIATGRVTVHDMIEVAQTEMAGKTVGILSEEWNYTCGRFCPCSRFSGPPASRVRGRSRQLSIGLRPFFCHSHADGGAKLLAVRVL